MYGHTFKHTIARPVIFNSDMSSVCLAIKVINYLICVSCQVFDGHGGKHAADFACHHLPKFIVEDESFPSDIERVVASAFLQTDTAFAEACSLDAALASGTTALAALVIGRLVFDAFLMLGPCSMLYFFN